MDNIKGVVAGTIITLVIGGGAYTISQVDVAKNFADDTGLTQEQAEQYINQIPEEELASWDVIGNDYVTESQDLLSMASEIDCVNYEYEWESATLSCLEGKSQIGKLGLSSSSLGQAYIKLASDSASEDDINETIRFIDQINSDYKLEIAGSLWDKPTIEETIKTNSYNKALLKTALESE